MGATTEPVAPQRGAAEGDDEEGPDRGPETWMEPNRGLARALGVATSRAAPDAPPNRRFRVGLAMPSVVD